MRLKKYISLLLLAVYLFAVGGQVYAVLSCRCVAMKAAETHACCHHCAHDEASTADTLFKAPCCSDHHSIESDLYTVSSSDNERLVARAVVLDLPDAMVAEFCTCDCDCPDVYTRIISPQQVLDTEPLVFSQGLRAPPVLA